MFSSNNCIDIDNADNHTPSPSAFHTPICSPQALAMQSETPPIQISNPIRPIPTSSGFSSSSPPTNINVPNLPMPATYNNYPSIWYENILGNGLTYATNDSMPFVHAYHRQRKFEPRGHPYAPIYCTSKMLASADDEIQAYSNFGYLREIYPRNGFTNYSSVASLCNNNVFKQARPNNSSITPLNVQSVIENGQTQSSFGSSSFSPKQVSGGYFSHESNNMRITSLTASLSAAKPSTPVNASPKCNEQDHGHGQNNQSGNETKENTTITITTKKKRGRKPKEKCVNTKNEMVVSIPGGLALFRVPLKKKRGRPPKPKTDLFASFERYESGKSPNSTQSTISNEVPGPSSSHIAEADKARDEYINATKHGVTSSHAKRCKRQTNTTVPLIETNGRNIAEEGNVNYNEENMTECEPSHIAPPETRDDTSTNEQEKTSTTTQAIVLPSAWKTTIKNSDDSATKEESNHVKGQPNLSPSKIDKKNKLRRRKMSKGQLNIIPSKLDDKSKPKRKRIKKKHVSSSNGMMIESVSDKQQGFINDQAVTNKRNSILNTTCIAPNVAKSNLDMPNIFDMLESQAPPPSQADKDDEQSEILSDLEEMINVHIYGNDEEKSKKLETNVTTNRCNAQSVPGREVRSYSPCFLSDASDDESNDAEVKMHTNIYSIQENSLIDNAYLRNSSNETRSSLPQNLFSKTLPISEPISHLPQLNGKSNSVFIDVENWSTKSSVTFLGRFSSQSGDSNQQAPNVFGNSTRQNYLHVLNDIDHRYSSKVFNSAVERSVGRIFGEFYSQDDILETAKIPQTNNFNAIAFPQCRDPTLAHVCNENLLVDNQNSNFISLWEEITKFNHEEEEKFRVYPFANNKEHIPLSNSNISNPKRMCTINPDECESSAFTKPCKLPSTEKFHEEKEGNTSPEEIFEYEEQHILPTTVFGSCADLTNSFISGPKSQVHDYDSFDRLAYSQSESDLATFNARDWHQDVSPESLPLPLEDPGHAMNSMDGNCTLTGNSLARTDYIRGKCQGPNNAFHAAVSSNSCNSNRMTHQNDDKSNSVVARKIETMSNSSFGGKRQTVVHYMKNSQSQDIGPNNMTKSNKSIRTNPMIKKLIKFTKSQTGTSCVNETKSKLNADLAKVFLLGSNKPKPSPFSKQKSHMKEVMLEIPGPMERRARNSELSNKKVAQNSDSAIEKILRYRELAKKKIADQITAKSSRKENRIRKMLSNKAQIAASKIEKLSNRNSSKSEQQTIAKKQNIYTKCVLQSVGENEEMTNTEGVLTQRNEDTGMNEEIISLPEIENEMVNIIEVQTQQNEDADMNEEIISSPQNPEVVNNTEVKTGNENEEIYFDEDDDDILNIHAERDALLDF